MKLRVKIGNIRTDNGTFSVGQEFDIDKKTASSFLREGIVEVVEDAQPIAKPEAPKPQELPKEEPKKEEVAKVEKEVEKKPKLEIEPTMDWTIKELVDFATSKGFEVPDGSSKREVLAIIEGGEKK